MGTEIAPASATPKSNIDHSTLVEEMMETLSPPCTPRATSPFAASSALDCNSPQVSGVQAPFFFRKAAVRRASCEARERKRPPTDRIEASSSRCFCIPSKVFSAVAMDSSRWNDGRDAFGAKPSAAFYVAPNASRAISWRDPSSASVPERRPGGERPGFPA